MSARKKYEFRLRPSGVPGLSPVCTQVQDFRHRKETAVDYSISFDHVRDGEQLPGSQRSGRLHFGISLDTRFEEPIRRGEMLLTVFEKPDPGV
jgi:hypothetical protein